MRIDPFTTTTLGEIPQFALAALIVVFLVISLVMILVVLIQKPQGGGLSGAFGASAEGAGQTAFGAKTGDVLTVVTVGVFVLFLVVAGALNLMIEPPTPATEDAVAESTTEASEESAEQSDGDAVRTFSIGGDGQIMDTTEPDQEQAAPTDGDAEATEEQQEQAPEATSEESQENTEESNESNTEGSGQ